MATTTTTATTTGGRGAPLRLPDAPAIDGLRFRRPRGDDADWAAMAALTTAANQHDAIPFMPTAANLREEIEASEGCDPASDLVVAELDGRMVAEAGVDRVIRGGIAVYETWGHVLPEVRRRGLGRALLGENLRRIAERGAAEAADQSWEARGYVDEGETAHHALLAAAGFEPLRYFFLMRRPTLDDIPDAPLPDGLVVRPVSPDQHRVIWEAEAEAFRDHWQSREPTDAEYEMTFRREELDTSLWVVAWDGDEVAGVVQTWVWGEENAAMGVDRGWLEHISVRRPWRRRGVGRAITAEALRRLRAAGLSEAMLGVDAENPTGALGLYEGLGFAVHKRSTAYRLDLRRR